MASNKNIVHVVGTGTIGEPLIGLFTQFKDKWNISEVTFHKRTPALEGRAMVNSLINRGARLTADEAARDDFARLGHRVSYTTEEALERATVVVDCTPAGNENKHLYKKIKGPKGFLAQGSEFGFGKPYARGINDEVQSPDERFVQIVSCNTHNISVLLKTLGCDEAGKMSLQAGRFVCMRRANDVSDTKSFIAAPQAGKHDDPTFGTHHARDAHYLFETIGEDLNLFSSAIKLNTQYMHTLWFDLDLKHDTSLDEVKLAFRNNPRVAVTTKRYVNEIFSFGRDHGYYGRILSQTVVPIPTVTVPSPRKIVGFCYTPQDGNSLLSSIAATLRYLDASTIDENLEVLRPYMFQEI